MRCRNTFIALCSLIVVALAGCGGLSEGSERPSINYKPISCLRPTCEEVSVRRGDVTLSVEGDGVLRYVNKANLSFDSEGTIASVNVEIGDVVKAGDVLVELDSRPLQLEAARARIALQNAEESLEDMLEPATSVGLLRAEDKVAIAAAVVEQAKLALEQARAGATAQEAAQAKANVSKAELAVLESQQALEDLKMGPAPEIVSEARAAFANSTLAMLEAHQALVELQTPANPIKVQEAKDRLELAQTTLESKQGYLDLLEDGPDPSLIQQRKLELALAKLRLAQAEEELDDLKKGKTGSNIDVDEFAFRFNRLEADIEVSRLLVARAETALDDAMSGPGEEALAQARADVSTAAVNVQVARDALDGLTSGPTKEELAAARARASGSQLAIEAARQRLQQLEAPPDELHIQALEDRLDLARATLQEAQKRLAQLEPDPLMIKDRAFKLAQAEEALLAAQEKLDRVRNGPGQLEIDLRLSEIVAARARLDEAERNLSDTTVVAPFDGIISAVNVQDGQHVASGRLADSAVQVVDTGVLEMASLVDETDIARVQVGQEANISINALPGNIVQGTVIGISDTPADTGAAMYEVIISSESDQLAHLNLLEGMTAHADIVIDQRQDVLYVPSAALISDDGQARVEVVNGEAASLVMVIPGLKNGRYIEVKEGLQEGDIVRVNRSNSSILPID